MQPLYYPMLYSITIFSTLDGSNSLDVKAIPLDVNDCSLQRFPFYSIITFLKTQYSLPTLLNLGHVP